MQIGIADLRTASAYLSKFVPRRFCAGLTLVAAGAFLHRLALPIAAWLDTSRDHGIQRAHIRPEQWQE